MDKKKLHICIVTGQFPALTETFVTNKVLELKKRGHIVSVITNQQAGHLNESHLSAVKKAGIEVLKFPIVNSTKHIIKSILLNPGIFLKSFSLNFANFKESYKSSMQVHLLTRSKYDIVHFEFSGLGVFYLNSLAKVNSKLIVSCRGTAEKVKPVTDTSRAEKLKELFSKMDAVHCVSQDMAETILPFTTSNNIVFVNRPSIDTKTFKRTKVYKDNDKKHILSIGRLIYQKGYMVGLLAIKALAEKGVNFLWTIVGDGPQWEELKYNIHALGLTQHVNLAGKKSRDEIIELYNSVDIFFLPSIYEGIANVCLEAMSMELPVISSDCSGMKEVIKHGVDGILVPNYDHQKMSECLANLSLDYKNRLRIGTEARKVICSNFTLERQINEFEHQYLKLIQD